MACFVKHYEVFSINLDKKLSKLFVLGVSGGAFWRSVELPSGECTDGSGCPADQSQSESRQRASKTLQQLH